MQSSLQSPFSFIAKLGLRAAIGLFCGAAALLSAPQAYAAQVCSNFSPIAIPDNNPTGIVGALTISDRSLPIQDLNLKVNVTHTYVGDLIVKLKHVETGTTVTLIDRMGVPASGAGCSRDNLNVVLDDEGSGGTIEALCGSGVTVPTSPPSFTPNNALSGFDGQSIAGTWQLLVSDVATIDTGTLNSFCLTYNSTDIAVSASSTSFVSAVGSPFNVQYRVTNNGPFDAELVNLTTQVPAEVAITDIVQSSGSFYITPAGTFNYLISSIPSLPVGQTTTLDIQAVPSFIHSLAGGPITADILRVLVNAPASAPREFTAYPLNFDTTQHPASVTAAVILANDGLAPAPNGLTSDACEPLSAADVAGKIVLADNIFAPLPDYSGTPPPPPCSISTTMINARNAGAAGLLVQNITDNAVPPFGAIPPPPGGFAIPVAVIGKQMGSLLRSGGNVTMQLGHSSAWDLFTGVFGGDGDDVNPQNNQRYMVLPIGDDTDDDSVADVIDACASDSAKVAPGICGCGKVDSTRDVNFNSIADCNEDPSALVPPKPKLRQVKSTVRVTMSALSGANYILTVSIKAPGARKAKTRVIKSSKNVVNLANVLPGSTISAKYSFALTSPSISSTLTSVEAKLKTK